MKSLDNISEDLFNKIRGRFPSVTIGDQDGKITNDPLTARFFDFDYKEGDRNIGKVSISISEDKLSVMYSNSFVENEDTLTRQNWYNFLKELRTFAKKRLLQFDTRDITKSNLNKRDYEFLAQQQGGDTTMSESKLYGTGKISYQDVGAARLNIKHTQHVNPDLPASRTQHIDKIYIESAEGERFMYPYRHLAGARAMARHVAEGGKPYDDFGNHIVGLSEEVSKLRKFKTYMGRNSVMAEGLSGYLDAVIERIDSIKTELNHIQRPKMYQEAIANFENVVLEEVPEDVAENWIDQLTIRQFNEELKDIFPYVYRLVSEHTRAQILSHQDLLDEDEVDEGGVSTLIKSLGKAFDTPAKKTIATGTAGAAAGAYTKGKVDQHMAYRTALGKALYDACESGNDEEACEHLKNLDLYKDSGNKAVIRHLANMYNVEGDPLAGPEPTGKAKRGRFEEFEEWANEIEDNALESDDDKMQIKCNPKYDPMAKFCKPGEKPKDKEKKTPVTEFILSLYDRNTGEFPKGETAVLTAVEKDYGEHFIDPAKQFIERIKETYDQYQMEANPQQMQGSEDNMDDVANTGNVAPGGSYKPAGPHKLDKEVNLWNDRMAKVGMVNSHMQGGPNVNLQQSAASKKAIADTVAAAIQFRAKAVAQGVDPSKFSYDEKGNMASSKPIPQTSQDYFMKDDTADFDRMRELAGLR